MRARLFLLSFVFLLVLGCGSDDHNGQLAVNENNLFGKWYPKSTSVNGGEYTDHEHKCSTSKDVTDFLVNGELSSTTYYTDCQFSIMHALWSLDGNKLIVESSEFDPVTRYNLYEVLSLTREELTLQQDFSEGNVRVVLKYTRE